MKFLKRVVLVIIGLLVICLIAAIFIKKDYTVEREITINKPRSEVFAFIKMLKNQDLYSVWNRMDPQMKKTYRGTDGTPGFVVSWEGNSNVGKGEQEITKITGEERIDSQLRFKEPFAVEAAAYLITESVSETQTKVRWGFVGNLKYPMNLMLVFMNIEKMTGKDLQMGLNNLKSVLEK